MKNIKTVLVKLLCIVLALVVFSAAGIYIYKPQIKQTNEGSYLDKIETLKSMSGKKAVFVGGSATHFGINAKTFTEETGIQAVNMGLTAGVPFFMYLESVIPYLNADDVLFVTPEYGYYSREYFDINDSGVNFTFYLNNEVYNKLGFSEKCALFKQALSVGWTDWGNFLQEKSKQIIFGESFGVYYRKNSDKYGDFLENTADKAKTIPEFTFVYEDNGFVCAFEKQLKEIADNGTKIILLYPPFVEHAFKSSTQSINVLRAQLEKIECCTILYQPEETGYSKDMFFDTVYHLNADAAKTHTSMIAARFLQMQNN